MSRTTFSGPVSSANGFIGPDNPVATTAGAGITGAASITYNKVKTGNIISTQIFIDIAGLTSSATGGDIIGVDATGAAYLMQILNSECGQVYAGSMSCLEAPTTGDPDIDLYSATEATGVEDTAIGSLEEVAVVTAAASWTVGMTKAFTSWPANGKYLYLTVGNTGVAGVYATGQFLIEMLGYEA